MSSEFYLPIDRDSVPVKGYKGKKKKHFYLIGLAIIALFIMGEAAFRFFIVPELTIRKIDIHCSADFPLSNEEILKVANLGKMSYYFSINTEEIETILMKHPLVKSVAVEKIFPVSLAIYISGRTPLAMALVSFENRTIPIVFDEEGVVFEIGKSVSNYDLPVVSGLKFADVKLGMKLPVRFDNYFSDLKLVKAENPILFQQISEFRFVNKGASDYEVLLYPVNSYIKVRTRSQIDQTLVKQIFLVLDIVEKNRIEFQMNELDFRSGQGVFKVKEG